MFSFDDEPKHLLDFEEIKLNKCSPSYKPKCGFGGWIVVQESDGAVLADLSGNIAMLFMSETLAKEYLNGFISTGVSGVWAVIQVGVIF